MLGDAEAKVLAGGQSLVPMMAMRLARPSVLVDLGAVPGLDGIERQNDELVTGAMVRQRALRRRLRFRRDRASSRRFCALRGGRSGAPRVCPRGAFGGRPRPGGR